MSYALTSYISLSIIVLYAEMTVNIRKCSLNTVVSRGVEICDKSANIETPTTIFYRQRPKLLVSFAEAENVERMFKED